MNHCPMIARPSAPLLGEVAAPGDKSLSHRALILAGLAPGVSWIRNLLQGDDVLRTAAALRAVGVDIERENCAWRIVGGPWSNPEKALYFGNSGTGCRLMMGASAGAGISAVFDGDLSLRGRPMNRVIEPLKAMGAVFEHAIERLPVRLRMGGCLKAIDYTLPTPSAQVKSAILLAGLGATGTTVVRETAPSRDHTERMLAQFGAPLNLGASGGARVISLNGPCALSPCDIDVPGDPSSAAFIVAGALLVPGSEVLVRNVLVNPLRSGFFSTVREMGADIGIENERIVGGEAVADIRARFSTLNGVHIPAARAPSMIDEYPILAVLAASAKGETRMEGLGELRVKESDRLSAIAAALGLAGVSYSSGPDWIAVAGAGCPPKGACTIATMADHRIAMSFLIMGLASREAIAVDDAAMIATSFPVFVETMRCLGASIGPPGSVS